MPLTSIQGFLKLIKQNISSEMNQKIANYLKIIDDEFESINMQITGFLSFSRNREQDEMIRVQKKGIQQVISNLLNNAVDALVEVSHKKEITLAMKEDDDNVYLYISNNVVAYFMFSVVR